MVLDTALLVLLFAWLCYVASRYKRWPGALASHATLTLLISYIENDWIQREMNRPGWQGIPDADIVFHMSLLSDMAVANIILLPVTACGLYQAYSKPQPVGGPDNLLSGSRSDKRT